MLVFKNQGQNTRHRALIYPSRDNYMFFIGKMKDALGKYNRQHFDALNSRINLTFRGKFIFDFDEKLWSKLGSEIKSILNDLNLGFVLRNMIVKKRMEITVNEKMVS